MTASDVQAGREGPIVLFDGHCNLCNRAVRFILRRDRRGEFRFASLQSEAGAAIRAEAGGSSALPDSIVLVEGGRVHIRSDAALRIARRLGGAWAIAWRLRVVPRPLRDWIYDRVAKNRYRLFGRREECARPTPELRTRFLDG